MEEAYGKGYCENFANTTDLCPKAKSPKAEVPIELKRLVYDYARENVAVVQVFTGEIKQNKLCVGPW